MRKEQLFIKISYRIKQSYWFFPPWCYKRQYVGYVSVLPSSSPKILLMAK